MSRRGGSLEAIWLGSKKKSRKRNLFGDGDHSCSFRTSSVSFDSTSPPLRKQPARQSVLLGKEKWAKSVEVYSLIPKSSEELIADVIEANTLLIMGRKSPAGAECNCSTNEKSLITLCESGQDETDPKFLNSQGTSDPSLPLSIGNLSSAVELLLEGTHLLSKKATEQFARIEAELALVEESCSELRKDLSMFQPPNDEGVKKE